LYWPLLQVVAVMKRRPPIRVYRRDAIEGLRTLDTGSARLVLADLPAAVTRASFDRFPDLEGFFQESWRVLHPNGAVVALAASFRFAVQVVEADAARFRYDLVWHKNRATGFLNARKGPLRAHEFILVFSKQQAVYNPQMTHGHTPINSNKGRKSTGVNYGAASGGRARSGATDRYPRSVLTTATVGTTDPSRTHPQQKPQELMRWLVSTYSDRGDLVVDPYAGSGSTGVACRDLGRRFIGFDDSFGWLP